MTDLRMPSLNGRVALVTGASRGIGQQCALALAKAGAQVVACARTQSGLEELDDAIYAATGQHATLIPFDLVDGSAMERLGPVLYERYGKLDILVHAAAHLGSLSPVTCTDPKDFGKIISINLTASYRLIRSVEPVLRLSDAARAVFFTSGVASSPRAFWGPYAASKAGLEAMVRCWLDEIEHTPIRGALVNPGPTQTRMRHEAYPGEDKSLLTLPEAIAPMVLDMVRTDREPPLHTVHFRDWAEVAH